MNSGVKESMIVNAQELDDLKKQLEEERKKKKELASANVKLNGMLKIGQDAIKAEQDAVKQLQEQLDTISSHGSQVEKQKRKTSQGVELCVQLNYGPFIVSNEPLPSKAYSCNRSKIAGASNWLIFNDNLYR